jgi:hypothetical protein
VKNYEKKTKKSLCPKFQNWFTPEVIFPNIIPYLDRTFKEEHNYINFKNELILLNWC